MTEYCTSTQVQNRLTSAGYGNLADRDDDGTVSAAELAAYVTQAIQQAGDDIDYALVNHQPAYDTAAARGASNSFLRSRAIDIACWYVATNGGRDAPEAIQAGYDKSKDMLDDIQKHGNIVPGLTGAQTWSDSNHEAFEIQSGGRT